MNTPICDFVDGYTAKKTERLHMPGHKGKPSLGVEERDITEVFGTDGLIRESETAAASLFRSARTVFSAEGSTLAIKEMVYLAAAFAKETGKEPYILAARNIHVAFLSAVVQTDVPFGFIAPQGDLISQKITPEILSRAIAESERRPTAVYVTSPDYLGNMLDIKALKTVCSKHGCILLVDNAHGAYLNFLSENKHPLRLGADMCADSAHKTLPCLTGGAYLHINKPVYEVIGGYIENAKALFSSTSPSWLILQSLDRLNGINVDERIKASDRLSERLSDLKNRLSAAGWSVVSDEPFKISLSTESYGYTGTEIARILREKNIECEFSDDDYITFMFTPENGDGAIEKLFSALSDIDRCESRASEPLSVKPLKRALSPRQAIGALSEEIETSAAVGRIFASCKISCPPAIPIVVAGEVVDENAIALLLRYGIKKIRVVK